MIGSAWRDTLWYRDNHSHLKGGTGRPLSGANQSQPVVPRPAPPKPLVRSELEGVVVGWRCHGVFVDRSSREPLAPAPHVQQRPCERPAPNRFCSWGKAPFALIVYSGGVATPHRWAGLFSPTPGSMVSRSSFALATVSRETSSVLHRRLAAGGRLFSSSQWSPRN